MSNYMKNVIVTVIAIAIGITAIITLSNTNFAFQSGNSQEPPSNTKHSNNDNQEIAHLQNADYYIAQVESESTDDKANDNSEYQCSCNNNNGYSFKDFCTIITGIAGIVTSIFAILISASSNKRNRLEVLNQYFSYAREKDIVYGKRLIYNASPNQIEDMKKDFPHRVPDTVVEVINFYHHWGFMLKLHDLPMFLFYDKKTGITASGIAVIRTFETLKPIIDCYKEKNSRYAEYYKYLYDEINKEVSKAEQKAKGEDNE